MSLPVVPAAADADVERAISPMRRIGLLASAHIGSELRQGESQRHLAAQDAARRFTFPGTITARRTLAGDNQDELGALGLRPPQEAQERRVRLRLRLAMQIETGIDGDDAARKALFLPAVQRSGEPHGRSRSGVLARRSSQRPRFGRA